jgi:caa(3)-type oxidase subunit IV
MDKQDNHHHHILPNRMVLIIGGCLMLLTGLTVFTAGIDLGRLNFPIAMLIALTKASLVAFFFMNLLYERRENAVIFFTSFIFLAIFMTLTSTDLFFRGDVYVKKGQPLMASGSQKSTLKDPWISTPQLVARGKELFQENQCATCHGPEGFGNGPAAAGYNPHPRNFHSNEGWDNGRKESGVFKTLKNGVPGTGMASYGTLPPDDRWALAAYVLSLGPQPVPADTVDELAAIGFGPKAKNGGAEEEAPSISIDLAMDRMTQDHPVGAHHLVSGYALERAQAQATSPGGQLYTARCAECHGLRAEGGIRVANLGEIPKAFIVTRALSHELGSMQSREAFTKVVVNGMIGNVMPSYGQLTDSEISELYDYVRSLNASQGIANR